MNGATLGYFSRPRSQWSDERDVADLTPNPDPETDLAKEWRQRNEDKKSPRSHSFASIPLPKIPLSESFPSGCVPRGCSNLPACRPLLRPLRFFPSLRCSGFSRLGGASGRGRGEAEHRRDGKKRRGQRNPTSHLRNEHRTRSQNPKKLRRKFQRLGPRLASGATAGFWRRRVSRSYWSSRPMLCAPRSSLRMASMP